MKTKLIYCVKKQSLKQLKTEIIFVDRIKDIFLHFGLMKSRSKNQSSQINLLIIDTKLKTRLNLASIQNQENKIYWVESGEKLKSIESLGLHLQKISQLCGTALLANIIVIGGGSIGDFGGFIASVYKRGVTLKHVPSTWLAAIDSSHGGKNALNLDGYKNQIGTFHFAEKVIVCRDLLKNQSSDRLDDAFGELFKMALLKGKSFWTDFAKNNFDDLEDSLWSFLPRAIQAKYEIVLTDPFERMGIRRFLNLGHTYGHAFESILNLTHGLSVCIGTYFSLMISRELNYLSNQQFNYILESESGQKLMSICCQHNLFSQASSISAVILKKCLIADKKKQANAKIQFIFLKGVGSPFIGELSIAELVKYWKKFSRGVDGSRRERVT